MDRVVHRRGTVLVLAIWVILILSALVMVYTRSMRVELVASGNRLAAEQAAAVERGAEQYVLARIDGAKGDAFEVTSAPAEAVAVGDGYFWMIRPQAGQSNGFEYGIADEAGKLNLNVADAAELAKLPGLTQEFSFALMDWRDDDSELTQGGAESPFYLAQTPPYNCKNGLLETVEELRLLKGATDGLIYGYDRNQNGASDDVWPAGAGAGTGTGTGAVRPMLSSLTADQRGLAPFVTVFSAERNVDLNGKSRVNVAKAGGGDEGGPTPTPTPTPTPAPGGNGRPPRGARQVAPPTPTPTPGQPTPGQPGEGGDASGSDLATALQEFLRPERVQEIITRAGQNKPWANVFDFAAKSGMTDDELRQVFDRLTSVDGRTINGRVNVNTAPREVLRCLPGLELEDADALISRRPSTKGGDAAWVLNALGPEKLASAGAAITGRSFQYSADIVAASSDGRAFKRVRIVVDARQSPPIIIRRKDLTPLGWPLSEALRAQLKSGQRLQTGFRAVRAQGVQ